MFAFTSHNRDLVFAGIRHRSAPGMVPSAIRVTASLTADSADVEGALSHDTISEEDLKAGLFDEASIEIGALSWETLETIQVYTGHLGRVEDDRFSYSAELRSAKRLLEQDFVPRTSPTCRAEFCGVGCGLSARRFTTLDSVVSLDLDRNRVQLASASDTTHLDGRLRFQDGPQTGVIFGILAVESDWFTLDHRLVPGTRSDTKVELQEGCDHTIATCHSRFSNVANFRGEPFLPGNDLLARYGQGA